MRTLLAGNVPLLSSVPAGGIQTPTTTADVRFMQQDASNNNLELTLAQTAMILGTRYRRAAVRGAPVTRPPRRGLLAPYFLADTLREVILPPGLQSTEQTMAYQFLSSLSSSGTANFDQMYLTMMVQMHTQTIQTFQSQLAAATDRDSRRSSRASFPSSRRT